MDEIVGEMVAWKKHHTTGQVVKQLVTYRIGEYPLALNPDGTQPAPWITLSIISGGVTGHESLVLVDGEGVCLETLDKLFMLPYWSACAGAPGRWHEQRVHRSEMQRILLHWVTQQAGQCHKCQSTEACLAEDPLLLREEGKYEFNFWCADHHSQRDKEARA